MLWGEPGAPPWVRLAGLHGGARLNSLRKSHSYGRKTPGAKCGVSNSASNLVTATYPNALQSTFQYDTMNRLTSMTAGTTAAYGYTLGPTSVRTNAIELSGRSVTWGFDAIYRLTGETVTGDTQYNW